MSVSPALAQITGDGSLGSEVNGSLLDPCVTDLCTITGGTVSGTNLFHSFREFSLITGSSAYFDHALEVQNIFARVTGGFPSNLDGALQATGANLFLLNPSGIVFGPNAQLDIGGSFLATTASSLHFADGEIFSATAQSPLLSINTPIGLQYGTTPQSIQVQGSALQVAPGQSLVLAGGEIVIDGGHLNAPGGHLELGGLAVPGMLGLTVGDQLSLYFPGDVTRANLTLTNAATARVAGVENGSIAINVHDLNLSGASFISAGIESESGTPDNQAGDINVHSTGAITLLDEAAIANIVQESAIGNAGNINITTDSISLSNRSSLLTATFGIGNAGAVNIIAHNTVSFDNSDIFSTVEADAVGNAGNINIFARSLAVMHGSQLQSLIRGQGNAGNININAGDFVTFDGTNDQGDRSMAASSLEAGSAGNAGNVDINTGSLFLTHGAVLNTATTGLGNAGSVNITARDLVAISNGSLIFSTVNAGAVGDGGGINITTDSISLTNGSSLASATLGVGDAGAVNMIARNRVFFDDSNIFSTVEEGAVGNASNINITAGSLSVMNGSQLQSLTRGQGNAGDINLYARDSVTFDGANIEGHQSGAGSTVEATGIGNGGNINVQTGFLALTNGGELSASSAGQGSAGSLKISAVNVLLDNQGKLTAETASGNGGNITLTVQELLSLRRNSQISTTAGTAEAGGDGGNINIDAKFIVAFPFENSDITANAFTGKGGRVQIQTQGIFGTQFRPELTPESDITASSTFGVSGIVEIKTPDVDPSKGLVEPETEVVDPAGLIAQSCSAIPQPTAGQFVITGRGGLPLSPHEALSEAMILTDLGKPLSSGASRSQAQYAGLSQQAIPSVVTQAQGWRINPDGKVELLSQAPNAIPHHPWLTAASCNPSSRMSDRKT